MTATVEELLPTSLLFEQEFGDIVNRREFLFDTPGFGFGNYDQRVTSASDRVRGKCSPFFENEMDLAAIRGIARFLAGTTEIAIGALENLTSYTIGNGLTYTVEPKRESHKVDSATEPLTPEQAEDKKEDIRARQATRAVQEALDEALEANQWVGDKEAEAFRRSHRDGECFIWVREYSGQPQIMLVEPDYITEPVPSREVEDYCGCQPGLEWSFGIASDHCDMERRHAYFVKWPGGAGTDWDVAPTGEMVHVRLNVDRGVKRGISDFYAAYVNMERAAKLLGNTLQGAAIQATIAYIKEHVAGTTSDSITSTRNARSDFTATFNRPGGGSRQIRQEKFFPGRVIDTTGTKYHAGPLGQSSAPTYIDVVQAGLRIVGARWAMPEYMISGDASNANYSSTLMSGGPFDKATQRRQGLYKRHFAEVCWKVLGILASRGRFREHGILSLRDLKKVLQVKVEAPAVAVQDRKQEEEIRQIRHDAGILSKKTWAAQAELDFEVELANGAAEKAEPSPFGAPPVPGQPPNQPPLPQPRQASKFRRLGQPPEKDAGDANAEAKRQAIVAAALESVRTTAEARAVLSEAYP